MKWQGILFAGLATFSVANAAQPQQAPYQARQNNKDVLVNTGHHNVSTWFNKTWLSTKQFYRPKNMLLLGGGVLVNGVLANSSMDQDFANWNQRHVRNHFTNNVSAVARQFGNLPVVAIGYAGAVGISYLTANSEFGSTFGRWTSNTLQGIVVGAPSVLILQRAIGSGRPERNSSKWCFGNQAHGVSGHAFLGAMPFITAAKMTTNPYGKAAWYAASALPGLSRINDNKHYLSQVLLGWWIAKLSADTVFHVEQHHIQVAPAYIPNGTGVGVNMPV